MEDCLGEPVESVSARLRSAARPMCVHFLTELPARAQVREEVRAAPAPVSAPAAAPAPPPAPAPAPAPVPAYSPAPIDGLIGGGVSYAGTGAAPKPASYAARKAKAAESGTGSKDGMLGQL